MRPCLQLVVPMSQRKIVLAELHEGVTGGHLGQEKTLMKLKERFYWPGHWNDVQNWCNTCAACISRKTPALNPAVPKGGSRKFHSPWTGPFKIVERVSEATYHIQNTVDGKTSIVHFDRLKRCRPDIRTNIKQTKKDNSPTCGSTAGKDPPGTHMELLDDDQPTHVPEHPQPNAVLNEDPEPEEGPEQDDDDPHIIVPQPGTATRYPTRQRRAPDYY